MKFLSVRHGFECLYFIVFIVFFFDNFHWSWKIHVLLFDAFWTPAEPSRGAMTWATLAQSVCLSALLATKDSITPLKAMGLCPSKNAYRDIPRVSKSILSLFFWKFQFVDSCVSTWESTSCCLFFLFIFLCPLVPFFPSFFLSFYSPLSLSLHAMFLTSFCSFKFQIS